MRKTKNVIIRIEKFICYSIFGDYVVRYLSLEIEKQQQIKK